MEPLSVDPANLFRLVHFFDILAAIVFAVSGSLVASRKRLDLIHWASVRSIPSRTTVILPMFQPEIRIYEMASSSRRSPCQLPFYARGRSIRRR